MLIQITWTPCSWNTYVTRYLSFFLSIQKEIQNDDASSWSIMLKSQKYKKAVTMFFFKKKFFLSFWSNQLRPLPNRRYNSIEQRSACKSEFYSQVASVSGSRRNHSITFIFIQPFLRAHIKLSSKTSLPLSHASREHEIVKSDSSDWNQFW